MRDEDTFQDLLLEPVLPLMQARIMVQAEEKGFQKESGLPLPFMECGGYWP